jgi:ABC-2 type transport system permease protein
MRAEPLVSLRRVLRDHRRAFLIWGASLTAITVFYMSFWPTMGDAMFEAIQGMPEGLMAAMGYDKIGTAGGYLEAVVYALIGPILLLVYGMSLAVRLTAGQEEDGTLELDLTAPVTRARLFWERLAAVWLLLAGLVTLVTIGVLVSDPLFDLGVDVPNVLASGVGLLLLVGAFATLAFALGAATGRRSVALGAAAAVAVVTYVFRGVANAAGVDVYAALSPFSWFLQGDPLANGLDLVGVAKIAAISVLAAPLGWWRFVRRDLMT